MRDEGEEAKVAFIRSMSFSWRTVRFATNVSFGATRIIVAILRKFNWVLRSASSRAEEAPTPNIKPAAVGLDKRESISGIRSLSNNDQWRNTGNHPVSTSCTGLAKNLASLNTSVTSLFQDLAASGMFARAISRSSKYFVRFSGKDFDLIVGTITCVVAIVVAASTRSVSTKIFDNFGVMEARTGRTPSVPLEVRISRECRVEPESVGPFSGLSA